MTMRRMKMIAKLPLLSTHQCRAPPFPAPLKNGLPAIFPTGVLQLFLDAVFIHHSVFPRNRNPIGRDIGARLPRQR